ncbi:uncharacterized protein LOC141686664 [Apium graveolens]|uniref:uncharacterized protein LOC141686664 n=1 Tax=Apium graveolens TaxID=4045 RepID=UPI003D794EF1
MLWSYRTSPWTSRGETSFKLAYGTEAMLPIELGSSSHRAINFDEIAKEEGLGINIELIDEVWDQTVAKMEKYKEKIKDHFGKKSRVKTFQAGNPVHRDIESSDPTNTGKLMPKWEGPYKVLLEVLDVLDERLVVVFVVETVDVVAASVVASSTSDVA